MKKRVHIAKRLAGLFSPLGGVRGGLILLTTILLLAGTRYAHAQNTSALPYINSTHLYRVPMGDIGNNVKWSISNPNASHETIELPNSLAWADSGRVENTDPVLDSAYIEIKFVESVFMDEGSIITGPWILRYEEHDADGGGCIAVRALEINPTDNLFYVTTNSTDDSDCNSFSGQVWDNTDDLSDSRDGTVDFTVTMHKAEAHQVTEWSFTGTITTTGTDYTDPTSLFSATTGTTTYGNWEISGISGDDFTMTVTVNNPETATYDIDAVTFTANIYGPAIYDVSVTLEIDDRQAISGENYNVVTDDNGSGDNNQTRTLWGIPNTSIVSVSSP